MNIFKRIRNLWQISGFYFTKYSVKNGNIYTENAEGEKPKMAQIIKRRDPIKEALKNE